VRRSVAASRERSWELQGVLEPTGVVQAQDLNARRSRLTHVRFLWPKDGERMMQLSTRNQLKGSVKTGTIMAQVPGRG
jgi:hypothetical protein